MTNGTGGRGSVASILVRFIGAATHAPPAFAPSRLVAGGDHCLPWRGAHYLDGRLRHTASDLRRVSCGLRLGRVIPLPPYANALQYTAPIVGIWMLIGIVLYFVLRSRSPEALDRMGDVYGGEAPSPTDSVE